MTDVKLPFGMRADTGAMVTIDAVMRGLACDCICPACRIPLVAAKGEIVRHHFRHYVNTDSCKNARETAIHRFAKQIICETLNLTLPHTLGPMRSAVAEHVADGMRFDVLATYDSEPVAIEVFVSHRVPMEKIEKLHHRQMTAVEIDLSYYRDVDIDEDAWREAVLHRAPRRWLVDPLHERTFRTWVETERQQREIERQPPDLQKLVEAHGDYRKITPEAWVRWDAETKLYDQRLRNGYFYQFKKTETA